MAIRLFLNDGCDMFSEITLADGAGSIFHESVRRAGNVPFVDDIVADRSGPAANRSSVMMHGSDLAVGSKGSSKCECSHTDTCWSASEAE